MLYSYLSDKLYRGCQENVPSKLEDLKNKVNIEQKMYIPQFLSPLCPQSGSFAMWWCSWERWLIIRCCTASITPVKSWLPWVKPCLRWGLGDSCVKETDWTVHLKTKLFIMNPALGTYYLFWEWKWNVFTLKFFPNLYEFLFLCWTHRNILWRMLVTK